MIYPHKKCKVESGKIKVKNEKSEIREPKAYKIRTGL
jgi:hypothetical protein